jgi:hypothetical protein
MVLRFRLAGSPAVSPSRTKHGGVFPTIHFASSRCCQCQQFELHLGTCPPGARLGASGALSPLARNFTSTVASAAPWLFPLRPALELVPVIIPLFNPCHCNCVLRVLTLRRLH